MADVSAVMQHLGCAESGLTAAEAAARLLRHGPNAISEQRRTPAVLKFLKHMTDRFSLLLLAGAALSLLGEFFQPGEGMALISIALLVTTVLNAVFAFWQELGVERAMSGFRRMLSPHARVVRGGEEQEIAASEVVPGDVLVLREGDRVPADARLFVSNGLKVDNSPLTGECEPQLRSTTPAKGLRLESRNLAFTGTMVTTGDGLGVVYGTGENTEIARIAGVTQGTRRVESPIRKELRHFIRVITIIALALGLFFFFSGWAIGNTFWINLVFAIGIIVANVPEGLLPTVTLALAIAARRMAKRNALLKTLDSAETLGCTSVICTDKTGTLTVNEMRVTELVSASGELLLEGPHHAAALRVMVLCNNARLDAASETVRALGDPTEAALLVHAERRQRGLVERLRAECQRLHERPFDGVTREMATVHRTEGGTEVYLKGAPEAVTAHCRAVANDGTECPMTPELALEIQERANQLARRGRRVLALARKRIGDGEQDLEAVSLRPDYEFVGLAAMHDPPRPEVRASVQKCHQAGIRIIVVTGDHPLTAECIAREVGVIGGERAAICTGADLAAWDNATLQEALRQPDVLFARTSPMDKLRIVTALQEMGEVVAVTGDGVNDAPALKRADIGVAMGKSGTDVAREAADMILMDDNFTTIVAAVEEGRVIYGNIRRFIGYVLTSNVPEIIPFVAFVLLGVPLPLPVLLILAIDLGTDLMPAIGLAAETAEEDVMRQPPRPRRQRLLSRSLLVTAYGLLGFIEAAAGFAAWYYVLHQGGWEYGQALEVTDPLYCRSIAAFFMAIVVCQVANVMIWRTTRESVFSKGLFRNRMVLVGIALELLFVLFMTDTAAGHYVFGTAPLSWDVWLVPVPFALFMLLASELIKRGRRRGDLPSPEHV